MKAESDPITDDEVLYRRVHRDRFSTTKVPMISPSAFEPRVKGRDPDIDGISLYRAACIKDANDVLALITDQDKRDANGVVAVRVSDLHKLGLTVNATPRDEIAGHVSIPEMCKDAMLDEDRKVRCKQWMLDLATISSRDENIVRQPKTL